MAPAGRGAGAYGLEPHSVEGVEVRPGETTRLEVVHPLGSFMAGRVVDWLRNGVKTRLSFHRMRDDGEPGSVPVRTQESQEDGAFLAGALKPGCYSLFVRPTDGREGTVLHDLVIAPDDGLDGLEIVLPSPTGFAGWVVDDATGSPVERFTIETSWGEKTDRYTRSESGPKRSFVSETGQFETLGLRAGTYEVRVAAEGYSLEEPVRVDVRAGEVRGGVEIRMRAGGTIRGVVKDAVTGKGVDWAEVRVAHRRSAEQRTDMPEIGPFSKCGEEGRFEILGVRPGTVRIHAYATGFAEAVSEPFEIAPGRTVEGCVLPLTAGGAIEGIAVGADGRPLYPGYARASPTITFEWTQLARTWTQATDLDGRFRIEKLRPGKWEIGVHPFPVAEAISMEPLQGFVEVFEGQVTRAHVAPAPKRSDEPR